MYGCARSQIQPPVLTRFVGSETQAGPPVPAVPVALLPAVPDPVVPAVPEPVLPAVPEPVSPAVPEPVEPAVPEPVDVGDAHPYASRTPARQEVKEKERAARMGGLLR